MRARIRNVATVLALAIGLSLWAIPDGWGVAGIAVFLLFGALAVVLSVPSVSRHPANDAHLPRSDRDDQPGLGDSAWEESQRQPPYFPGG